jgi:hydrogenase nickel incorporation protein HypB
MCDKCGCSDRPLAQRPAAAHTHAGADELSRDDRLAERNRGFLHAKRVFAVNLLPFPAAGVQAFVRRTAAEFGPRRRLRIVDASFLDTIHARHAHGHHAPNTDPDGNECLDAHAVAHALEHLDLDHADVLLLVNGGSAALQAVRDLGATARVPLFSVRQGEAKPLKFPLLFANAAAVVLTETDQAAACLFDLAKGRANLAEVAPRAQWLEVSADTGAGMESWYAFLEAGVRQHQS